MSLRICDDRHEPITWDSGVLDDLNCPVCYLKALVKRVMREKEDLQSALDGKMGQASNSEIPDECNKHHWEEFTPSNYGVFDGVMRFVGDSENNR